MRNIAIIGGGVNGICSSIQLAKNNFKVSIFEANEPMLQTSAKSSRMLHGGIRYLEQRQFRAVRNALFERQYWLKNFNTNVKIERFYIPVLNNDKRGFLIWGSGVLLYQFIAQNKSIGMSRFHSKNEFKIICPQIQTPLLKGGVSYVDLVMDDEQLSKNLILIAQDLGVDLRSNSEVIGFNNSGEISLNTGETYSFNNIINAAGPWSADLVKKNGLQTNYKIRYIAGSHIILDYKLESCLLLPVPWDNRVIFLIPTQEGLLVGTTEEEVQSPNDIEVKSKEIQYLSEVIEYYLGPEVSRSKIKAQYKGIRPIAYKIGDNKSHFSTASRESIIEKNGCVYSIYGGKWTSAMSLGKKIVEKMLTEERLS